MKIIKKPNENQIAELKIWLKNEEAINGNGFYNNWDIIIEGINNKRTVLFEVKSEIIGFAQWTSHNKSISLNLFNIRSTFQKRGLGAKGYNLLEKEFVKKGYLAIELFCEPQESELFWIKMGYEKIPQTRFFRHELSYWKPIIKAQAGVSEASRNAIVLWDSYSINNEPKWIWDITNPKQDIIQYIDYDWCMRIIIEGKITNENKVKRITAELDEFIVAPYLYIPISKQLEFRNLTKEKQP